MLNYIEKTGIFIARSYRWFKKTTKHVFWVIFFLLRDNPPISWYIARSKKTPKIYRRWLDRWSILSLMFMIGVIIYLYLLVKPQNPLVYRMLQDNDLFYSHQVWLIMLAMIPVYPIWVIIFTKLWISKDLEAAEIHWYFLMFYLCVFCYFGWWTAWFWEMWLSRTGQQNALREVGTDWIRYYYSLDPELVREISIRLQPFIGDRPWTWTEYLFYPERIKARYEHQIEIDFSPTVRLYLEQSCRKVEQGICWKPHDRYSFEQIERRHYLLTHHLEVPASVIFEEMNVVEDCEHKLSRLHDLRAHSWHYWPPIDIATYDIHKDPHCRKGRWA